jgi:tellurite resistance protein TerC
MMAPVARLARRLAVAVVGTFVLAVGVAMIVLPGPASLVIPAGLAILGKEFPWARRLLERLRAALLDSGRRVQTMTASLRGVSRRSLPAGDRLAA